MQDEKEIIKEAAVENVKPKKKESTKKKYKVIVACEKFVIYVKENGHNVKLWGDFNLKIGDYIEI